MQFIKLDGKDKWFFRRLVIVNKLKKIMFVINGLKRTRTVRYESSIDIDGDTLFNKPVCPSCGEGLYYKNRCYGCGQRVKQARI